MDVHTAKIAIMLPDFDHFKSEMGSQITVAEKGLIMVSRDAIADAIMTSEFEVLKSKMESPIVISEKESICSKFGLTSIRGRAEYMEDNFDVQPHFLGYGNGIESSYFAVFDGHGCSHVASMCRDIFHSIIVQELEKSHCPIDWKDLLTVCFKTMDKSVEPMCTEGIGVLAMSRSIGDEYLKPYVIPDPEVTVTDRIQADEFLIIASDGLWDTMTDDKACAFASRCFEKYEHLSKKKMPSVKDADGACSYVAAMLTKKAFELTTDNITVLVVKLR